MKRSRRRRLAGSRKKAWISTRKVHRFTMLTGERHINWNEFRIGCPIVISARPPHLDDARDKG